MDDRYYKDKEAYNAKFVNNKLTIDDIIKAKKIKCLSVLIDLKGTKSLLKDNEYDYIKKINEFYNVVESFFSYRATNFGDFLAITFSDSFYIEIYNPESSKKKSFSASSHKDSGYELELLLAEIINLVSLIDSRGFKVRIFCSLGYTYRRVFQNTFAITIQKNEFLKPGLIHLFGFGNCMKNVFEAESGHFKGIFFVDEQLYKKIIIHMDDYGSYFLKLSNTKFICIINEKYKSEKFGGYLSEIDSHAFLLENLYSRIKSEQSELYKKDRKKFDFIWKKYVENYRDRIKNKN